MNPLSSLPEVCLLLCLLFTVMHPRAAVRADRSPERMHLAMVEGPFARLTPHELLTTDYRSLRARTGIRLHRLQRWALKRAQRRYRRGKLEVDGQPGDKPGKNKLGLIGLLLGAGSFLLLLIPYAAILAPFAAIAAIVLGILGIRRDEKPGMATAGLVLGTLNLLLMLVALVATAVYFGA